MIDGHDQRTTSSQFNHKRLKYLSIGGVLFGVLVRLIQYLSNRSLWSDEAMLATNIVDRSYAELLKPLDFNQAAPPLFLWIEKAAIQVFGNSEYALRLFPLIAALISLIAFYKLANRYASEIAAPIAIILFACLKHLLYYATEVKQYSSDVMVTLLLCLLLLPRRHQILNSRQLLLLGLIGSLLIWLSYPTVFVLAGIEISALLTASHSRKQMIVNRSPLYLVWIVSFVSLYWLTIRGALSNESLTSSWEAKYPNSLLDISWLFNAVVQFFYNPLGFDLGLPHDIAIFAFIVGCIACYRRNRSLLLTVAAPLIVTLIAAFLHKYPFRDRLVLFLTPLALLILAESIPFLLTQFRHRHRLALALGVLVSCVLLAPPIVQASQLVAYPTQVEELRPVIAYVRSHQQPGDRLYVYRSAKQQFFYYAPRYGYAPTDYVVGKLAMVSGNSRKPKLSEKGVKQTKQEVERFKGNPRVWFLFCRASDVEERKFLSIIQPIGQQLDGFKQHNAFVYLYDLSRR
jgi:uncharacterized membrane protein